jgi:hypothetical protein
MLGLLDRPKPRSIRQSRLTRAGRLKLWWKLPLRADTQ